MGDTNYSENSFKKDKNLASSIDKIIPLVDEMGEERFEQYMKAYLELGEDKHFFFTRFAEYIENCKKNKNGYKIMSIMSFKNFLLGMQNGGVR